jgi:negative regulator of flagellin synthesis FlgM
MNIPGELQRTQGAQETVSSSSAVEKTAKTEGANPVRPAATAGAGDEAHLSEAARAASIVSQPVAEADVRTEKVAAVQAALASGSYHVSSSQVAGKLIEHLLGNGS